MSARPLCSACPTCQAVTRELLRLPAPRATGAAPRPTRAGLERHAKRYGPELVPETAAEYGITVSVERPRRKPPRRLGPTRKERVAAYVESGYSVELIAELERIAPGRARRLVAQVEGEA